MAGKELGQEWISSFAKLLSLKYELLELNYRLSKAPEEQKEKIKRKIDAKQLEFEQIENSVNETISKIKDLPEQDRKEALNVTYQKSGPYKGCTPLTALFSAVPGSLSEELMGNLLTQLISLGADVNQLDAKGLGPIHYAVKRSIERKKEMDSLHYFDLLMKQRGLNIHLPTQKGVTAFHLAMVHDAINIIEPLVKLGAGLELLEPAQKNATAKGNNTKQEKKTENKFQSFYLYPSKGTIRSYVEQTSIEAQRIQQRDGAPPRGLENLDAQFNRDRIRLFANKKVDTDGRMLQDRVYRAPYTREQLLQKRSEYEALEIELAKKVEQQEFTEEQKVKTLQELIDEINKMKNEREQALAETSKKLDKIIEDPTEFLEKSEEEQQKILTSIFVEEHIPPLTEFRAELQSRADFLKRLKEERSIATEISAAKMLGHRLGFVGNFKYEANDKKRKDVDYEGFSVYRTGLEINHRVSSFNQLVQADQAISYIDEKFTPAEKKALQEVEDAYKEMDRAFDRDTYNDQARRYRNNKPVLIPCHWPGHLANIVLYKDRIYFSNKGGGTLVPSVKCYQIDVTKLPRTESGELDMPKMTTLIESLSTKNRSSDWSTNLALPELKALKPKLLYTRRLKGQKQGNCTYTNTKRGVDAVMMALKDDAKRLEKNKDVATLTPEEKKVLQYKDIDNKKVFKAFATYDRFASIEDYIEKVKDSPNVHKWDPLITYLKHKTNNDNDRTRAIASYVVDKLKSPPINMKDEEIAKRMNELKNKPSGADNFGYFARYLESGLLQKGERRDNFRMAFNFLMPGRKTYERNKVLIAAGMDPNVLPKSNLQTIVNFMKKAFRVKSKTEQSETDKVQIIPHDHQIVQKPSELTQEKPKGLTKHQRQALFSIMEKGMKQASADPQLQEKIMKEGFYLIYNEHDLHVSGKMWDIYRLYDSLQKDMQQKKFKNERSDSAKLEYYRDRIAGVIESGKGADDVKKELEAELKPYNPQATQRRVTAVVYSPTVTNNSVNPSTAKNDLSVSAEMTESPSSKNTESPAKEIEKKKI